MTITARPVLTDRQTHPIAREKLAADQNRDIVEEVRAAVAAHDVVVVGMSQNPVPAKARKFLREKGIAHHYLTYGSYFGPWRRRNQLKMWTGWPTFPMIFVKGTFIGGHAELMKLDASGELAKLLAGERVEA